MYAPQTTRHSTIDGRFKSYIFPPILWLRTDSLPLIGAHFGSTFPHLLLFTYPDLVPEGRTQIYKPKIFGFRVNERSVVGPKLQWLRQRPENDYEDYGMEYEDEELGERYQRGRDEESSLAGKVCTV